MGEIREDQKVTLYLKAGDGTSKELDCSIKSIQKDRLSLRYTDEVLDYAKHLEEGSEHPVRIFTPSGVKSFDTIVINSPLESEFVIEFVEDHIEIQRREYLRIELDTKIILETQKYGVVVTNTLDISGGGLRFFCDRPFQTGEIVKIMLYLPFQQNSVKAEGEIIDCEHIPEDQHVLVFTEIEERERDRIIKQCFDSQAELYK